jgi:hypothetical protein
MGMKGGPHQEKETTHDVVMGQNLAIAHPKPDVSKAPMSKKKRDLSIPSICFGWLNQP